MNECLEHLGFVAVGREEIGLTAYLDRLASESNYHVSMGKNIELGSPDESIYHCALP